MHATPQGLPPSHPVATEEIFGPVVTVHKFSTEVRGAAARALCSIACGSQRARVQEEVVGYANSVSYGLAGSVWTADLTRAHRVCEKVEAGMLWVNCWLVRCVHARTCTLTSA